MESTDAKRKTVGPDVSEKNWTQATLHVIDFEGHERYGVVEYGCVTIRDGMIAEVATALCRPVASIPEADTLVHGLRSEALEGLPPFSDHFERWVALRRSGLFVAHNHMVEARLIRSTWRYPSWVPKQPGSDRTVSDWGPWIDTLQLYRRAYPDLESHALMNLVNRFGLADELGRLAQNKCPDGRSRAHCALFDALASALLLQRLGADSAWGELSMTDLIEISRYGAPPFERQSELF